MTVNYFFMTRYRTKLLLFQFNGKICHEKLKAQIELLFQGNIENYLIVTQHYEEIEYVTYAYLDFKNRIDKYDHQFIVNIDGIELKSSIRSLHDKEITLLYLLKGSGRPNLITTNITDDLKQLSL